MPTLSQVARPSEGSRDLFGLIDIVKRRPESLIENRVWSRFGMHGGSIKQKDGQACITNQISING